MATPIDSTKSLTSGMLGSKPTTSPGSANMDKEAFLKLLVAQISHQDPLKPMEGTEFVSQLSQFSVVEQAIAQSKKLDELSLQMSGIASNEAVALVGKEVTVRGKVVRFDGASAQSVQASLDDAAAKVTVRIKDEAGNTVRTLDLGSKPKGALSIGWDGRDDQNNFVRAGTYSVEIQASRDNGESVGVTQDVKGVVRSISFEHGYPELELDSGAKAPISDLVSVGVISNVEGP